MPPPSRPPEPGRRLLFGAVAMVILGSFLPWVDTGIGSISGAQGAGLWTFYAAMLGLAGALIPNRTARLAQAAVFGVVSVALPVWQVIHAYNLVGFEGWRPGPGLVLVFGGGVVALVAASRIWRGTDA